MKFLIMLAIALAPAAALAADAPTTQPTHPTPTTQPTARQIVERIKQNVHIPWSAVTVDTFKAGDPDTPITGIATTHLDTLDVLKRAAASGKNLVITHEPTFYSHLDRTEPLRNDAVFQEKKAFIESHHMVVFRFHDHWHRREPDGIYLGVTEKIGWKPYQRPGEHAFFDIPPATLESIAADLKEKLHATVVRAVGPREMKLSKVGMLLGAAGSPNHIKMLERPDVELLIIGESAEWETVEYIRDAQSEGKTKALLLLGHANSEEAGMDTCAHWLRTFVPEVPVEFIPCGDPFWEPK